MSTQFAVSPSTGGVKLPVLLRTVTHRGATSVGQLSLELIVLLVRAGVPVVRAKRLLVEAHALNRVLQIIAGEGIVRIKTISLVVVRIVAVACVGGLVGVGGESGGLVVLVWSGVSVAAARLANTVQ